jgi:calcineurin-like phosphoesterase family protein
MEQKPRKLYISDWHYWHINCIYFDNRPFKTVEEMNAELIRRWNAAVNPCDTVYVLGDMFWCKTTDAIAVMKQLNGQKILIKGNHDRVRDAEFAKCFVKICDYLEVEDNGDNIVLSHYPIPCFKNHFYGWLHFYGHVHTSFEENMMRHNRYLMEELYTKPCEMYNVGAMMPYMDYTPRTKEEILANGGEYARAYREAKEIE